MHVRSLTYKNNLSFSPIPPFIENIVHPHPSQIRGIQSPPLCGVHKLTSLNYFSKFLLSYTVVTIYKKPFSGSVMAINQHLLT